ncbi:biofilm regulation protein phosphatase SiaA [Ectothiorhodospira shaposhnikovii]|uniref:biofilm regulation protein phosphatase SiaA n=1 Tax=Ectothiorhodospira shaposhnikovii TaxID=1054 RepID=UPI001EE91C72|nr:biofilm regulation protein phosphatase SiaA [Ectothiorhodospira shaposhnikovii]MCG5511689.1 biofilm regulation protein phosphatase SiaA [Ectothiorhodospira shaposhnikovii]
MLKYPQGLRAKSILALALACLVALVPAGLLGWQLLEGVRQYFGEAFAENFTRLNRERILAPVSRDLALSMRLADSELSRRWLLDEDNAEKRAMFFLEAEGYRRDFRDASYFLISALTSHYYFNSADQPFSDQPRYTLDPDKPSDAWFFNTLEQAADYNINVNPDLELGTTRVWLNVLVLDGERRIGLAGTGLDLSGFLEDFIHTRPVGVTPMILDHGGAIQAHPDPTLISFASTTTGAVNGYTLARRLPDDLQRTELAQAMQQARERIDTVPLLSVTLDGREQLLALAYIPELQWYVVTAVDLAAAAVIREAWLRAGLLVVALVLLILLIGFGLAVDRIVLRPLRELQQSASAMSQGRYDLQLPRAGKDELGDLARAFGRMAEQVKSHTDELEGRVEERTAELRQANQEMATAQRQIQASIDYASLIQRAILPDNRMADLLGPHHFVLWRPRDVVGGDFYLFHNDGERYLIGVVDCAGHGVPGALMTMLARAALDQAINTRGMASPAAVLHHADGIVREMLKDAETTQAIATHMDAGLVFVDRGRGILRYSGARISLYHSDGHEVEIVKGGRRALGDRRVGQYEDTELRLDPAATYYLVTDGYLDQSGGDLGFGLGTSRFKALLMAHARRPMAEQAAALDQALDDYRGKHDQRDDVTVLAFRVDQS